MAAPLAAEAAAGGAATSGEVAAGAPLRTPRAGGGAMAVDGKNRPPKPAATPAAKPAPKPADKPATGGKDQPPGGGKPEEAPQGAPGNRRERRGLPDPGGTVREGSWVVLGFLAWVWVALPFIRNGPGGVRDVLAAKFINRTPEGK